MNINEVIRKHDELICRLERNEDVYTEIWKLERNLSYSNLLHLIEFVPYKYIENKYCGSVPIHKMRLKER